RVADAAGKADSVASSPEEQIKKAKEALAQEGVNAEIERRKAEIAERRATGKDKAASEVAAAGLGLMPRAILATGGFLAKLGVLGSALLGAAIGAGAGLLLGVSGLVFPLLGAVLFASSGIGAGKSAQKAADGGSHLLAGLIGAGELYAAFALAPLGLGAAALPGTVMIVATIIFVPLVFATMIFMGRQTAKALQHVRSQAPDSSKDPAASMLAETGIAAAVAAGVIAVAAFFSPSFAALLKRMGNVMLGWIGMGVKKAETPEVLAQRIIDQLNDAKPVFNQKVAEASTLVEKLRIQVKNDEAKAKELDKTITAVLSDNDPYNDGLATGLQQSLNTVNAGLVQNREQVALAEKGLDNIKAERVRFFNEREAMIAEVNAQLSRNKQAEISKKLAELKGGFELGSIKDNLDKLKGRVDDRVADAAGKADSVASSPEEQ
ncbi:MAG: hypothetical protein FD126_3258, partial [Elusimicrobia bacterium]